MTVAAIAIALACALSVAGLLYGEARGLAVVKLAFKPAASAWFIALAVALGGFGSPYGQSVIAALVLCAIGDLLLLSRSRAALLSGMAAFGLGHAAYVAAFLLAGADYRPGVLGGAAVMAWFSWSVLKWLWPHLGAFRAPVAGYAAVISVMVVAGLAASLVSGDWRIALGAAAFAVSDVSVARDRFVHETFSNRAWGLPLYYAAQLLLASTV